MIAGRTSSLEPITNPRYCSTARSISSCRGWPLCSAASSSFFQSPTLNSTTIFLVFALATKCLPSMSVRRPLPSCDPIETSSDSHSGTSRSAAYSTRIYLSRICLRVHKLLSPGRHATYQYSFDKQYGYGIIRNRIGRNYPPFP